MSVRVVSRPLPEPRRKGRAARRLAAVALALFALGLWAQGLPAFVAWQLARDHRRGLSDSRRAARLWSTEPRDVAAWLEAQGTPVPPLPAQAGSAALVGAGYCALVDRVAAHVLYQGDDASVSVYVLSGPLRAPKGWSGSVRGLHLHFVRSAGRTLAIVGEREDDVDATLRAFVTSVAHVCPRANAAAPRG